MYYEHEQGEIRGAARHSPSLEHSVPGLCRGGLKDTGVSVSRRRMKENNGHESSCFNSAQTVRKIQREESIQRLMGV